MPQTQSTNKPISHLRADQNSALKNLTIISYLEGTSFLLLVGIAMPLKYMMGIAEGVKYIGMAHGGLFIAYIVILMFTAFKVKLPIWALPTGVLASFLPFGPFIFDHILHKRLRTPLDTSKK